MCNSAASQESSGSPSSLSAPCSSSSCNVGLLFSTFNFKHFFPLLLLSPEQAPMLNLHLSWLCDQTCRAFTPSQLHTHISCGPGCSTCSSILEEEAECCLLISVPVNTLSFESNHELNYPLCVILTGTHSSREGAGPALPSSPLLPLANQCRAHSSSHFLRVDFECSMVPQTTHFTGSGTESISFRLNQIKYSNESNNYLNLS